MLLPFDAELEPGDPEADVDGPDDGPSDDGGAGGGEPGKTIAPLVGTCEAHRRDLVRQGPLPVPTPDRQHFLTHHV